MLRMELERRSRRLTQAALGRECGIHPTTVSQIESGRVNATQRELRSLAEALKYAGDPSELAAEVSLQGQVDHA